MIPGISVSCIHVYTNSTFMFIVRILANILLFGCPVPMYLRSAHGCGPCATSSAPAVRATLASNVICCYSCFKTGQCTKQLPTLLSVSLAFS